MKISLCHLAVLLVLLAGCSRGSWSWLREAVIEQRPGEFQSDGVKITKFAVIGKLEVNGTAYHVAEARAVLTGMPSPRGKYYFMIVDDGGKIVNWIDSSILFQPLYCDGSKLYLFGFDSFPGAIVDPKLQAITPPDSVPVGNVVDFSNGITSPILTREAVYGSSGGIDQGDVWQRRP